MTEERPDGSQTGGLSRRQLYPPNNRCGGGEDGLEMVDGDAYNPPYWIGTSLSEAKFASSSLVCSRARSDFKKKVRRSSTRTQGWKSIAGDRKDPLAPPAGRRRQVLFTNSGSVRRWRRLGRKS